MSMHQSSRPFESSRGILVSTFAAIVLLLLAYVLLGLPGVGGGLVAITVRVAYVIRIRRSVPL